MGDKLTPRSSINHCLLLASYVMAACLRDSMEGSFGECIMTLAVAGQRPMTVSLDGKRGTLLGVLHCGFLSPLLSFLASTWLWTSGVAAAAVSMAMMALINTN